MVGQPEAVAGHVQLAAQCTGEARGRVAGQLAAVVAQGREVVGDRRRQTRGVAVAQALGDNAELFAQAPEIHQIDVLAAK